MRASGYEPPIEASKPESRLEEEHAEAPAPSKAGAGDAVTEASEASFPASDAPPWTSSVT